MLPARFRGTLRGDIHHLPCRSYHLPPRFSRRPDVTFHLSAPRVYLSYFLSRPCSRTVGLFLHACCSAGGVFFFPFFRTFPSLFLRLSRCAPSFGEFCILLGIARQKRFVSLSSSFRLYFAFPNEFPSAARSRFVPASRLRARCVRDVSLFLSLRLDSAVCTVHC